MKLGALALVLALSSGCMHAQAKVVVAPPPLIVPPAPPRIIEAEEAAEPEPLPAVPVADPAPPVPPRPRAAAPAPRTEPPKAGPAKPEAPPAEAARPAEEQRPPGALQTTSGEKEVELEGKIRGLLTQASTDLNRVNAQALGANARTQYETARGFVKQAEDALKARNLPFASSLADKAAALAAQLAGR